MERGADTFPFHNLLPYSESNEGLFLFFSPSLNWIKEKSVATLAIRNICDKKQNKILSQFSHRITRINELHASYMAYQYPLIFPYGEDDYRPNIAHRDSPINQNSSRNRLTIREWLSFCIQTRSTEAKTLL